ncbi:GTP cyclohydrolase IIa [Sporosarcina jiandibaonis]|uniref:GTP cyclohydrolase IIa n=1 Tax=Sporosarcina jiandibaonis TaxID=2715535 RepID=UPI0015578801|nr:GTP cyclohydrolase IIa [Sporosarcina jiandibaonis]
MPEKHTVNDNSEINIGIITPAALVNRTRETLKNFPNFKPIFRVIDNDTVIPDITKDLMNDVEVLIFTEYHAYKSVKQAIDFTIPVHHMPLMGTGLYRSLSIIKSGYSLNCLSIDTVEEKYVEQILMELKEDNYEIILYNGSSLIDEVVQFHIDNHKSFGAIALTGIQEVAIRLSELDIPNEWVTPTQQDMTVSLERALLATNTRRNKESQIVFGLINIDDFKGVIERYSTEYDVQLLKLNIQQMLLDYIKLLDGHLINLGGEEYSFITTRGIFERETRGYKFIPLLQEIKNELGITISLGVGFGRTAAEAGNHARLALRQSKELGGNVCYIVREDRSVLGPVDITTHKQYERYNLAITDPHLLDKAQKAGMSAAYMTKLMARVSRQKKINYTAQELASTLNVTLRSANRILLKWTDAELVEIIGEEKVTHKGRPRRIYRLSFIEEEHLL